MLARQAGEGHDRTEEKGDYQLTDVEMENLRFLSEHYRKLIVIVNVGGLIDLSFMDELPVSALVYYVQGGEEGGNALADLMLGKRNFSGKLTTSWPFRISDVPSSDSYSHSSPDRYIQDYKEGIYVGYRFYNSFDVRPRFPFGFGLSYTGFDISYEECVWVKTSMSGQACAPVYYWKRLCSSMHPRSAERKGERLVAFSKTAVNPGARVL